MMLVIIILQFCFLRQRGCAIVHKFADGAGKTLGSWVEFTDAENTAYNTTNCLSLLYVNYYV